jgi:hypothetical protein
MEVTLFDFEKYSSTKLYENLLCGFRVLLCLDTYRKTDRATLVCTPLPMCCGDKYFLLLIIHTKYFANTMTPWNNFQRNCMLHIAYVSNKFCHYGVKKLNYVPADK